MCGGCRWVDRYVGVCKEEWEGKNEQGQSESIVILWVKSHAIIFIFRAWSRWLSVRFVAICQAISGLNWRQLIYSFLVHMHADRSLTHSRI